MEPTWMERDNMGSLGENHARSSGSCLKPAAHKLLHSSPHLPCPKDPLDYRSLTSDIPITFKPSYPTSHSPISSGNHSFIRALPSMAATPAPQVKGLRASVPTADVGLNSLAIFLGRSAQG